MSLAAGPSRGEKRRETYQGGGGIYDRLIPISAAGNTEAFKRESEEG